MRWLVFILFALVFLAVELGLRAWITLPVGPYRAAAPSLLLILGVFVSLHAYRPVAVTAMLLLGVATDLTQAIGNLETAQTQAIFLLGPAALGFLLGAYVVLQFRTMMFHDSPITLAVMTLVAGLFVQLVLVAIITLRGVLPTDSVPDWQATSQLVQRAVSVIYAAVLALPLGLLLGRLKRLWLFEGGQSRRMTF